MDDAINDWMSVLAAPSNFPTPSKTEFYFTQPSANSPHYQFSLKIYFRCMNMNTRNMAEYWYLYHEIDSHDKFKHIHCKQKHQFT